ncbi:S8 family serine peptidase [Candidatus Nitrosotenuis chungbukensis]|uniref:S8 family serine peptidase n=1 Tax=Candidatus Nitrosotenuis chungbukensis TaxID=1353246 RepID=UPI001EE67977|nr:S8 family serine peptidase [Candidatus Nitrosotenuis chungbukensis]
MSSQKIQSDITLEILLDKSGKYVGADYPHDLGFNGNGIKVAVIDTGVDYSHPDLFGFGPSGKVVGGYDFIENDDSPNDTNGHGTEVAGIIAANGSLKGIAPSAKILAYRVSDTGEGVSSDLIIKAIHRAVADGANVINISLGVNRTNERIDEAINYAVKKGIVIVTAAGNNGPDPSTIGSPGKDPNTITVGATYNNITSSLVATLQINGERLQVLPMAGIKPTSEPVVAEIVFGKYGRAEDLIGVDARGKILLVERGSDKKDELVYFSDKEKNASSAGAKAIIVYNNEQGIFLGELNHKLTGPDYESTIPAVSMSREDGLSLKNRIQNKTIGTLNAFYHPDFVSFFSSRGPVSPFYIKPNLVAPGVFVNATSINGNYNLTSGTSFAAPHVSGAVAILLQKNPELTPHEINSIISTTADPISDTYETPFPLEISGVGRLNITKAFNANLIITPYQVIFDLSPHIKTQTATLQLKTINHESPKVNVDFKLNGDAVNFEHFLDGNHLYITSNLVREIPSEYQGMITLDDGTTKHHIPVLVRVSTSSVDAVNDNGKLNFRVYSNDTWSYAKISVYNDDSNLVSTASITPTKSDPVLIHEIGQYWIEANVKDGNNTVNVYNTILVESSAKDQIDFSAIGIPQRQILIIFGIMAIIAAVGIIIKKK